MRPNVLAQPAGAAARKRSAPRWLMPAHRRGGVMERRSKSAVSSAPSTLGRATVLADLDLLLTAVFCAADDLLPKRAKNARRRITDAEVVTLAVAQAVLGISSDRQFLRCARRRLAGLFPVLPTQDAFWKRRARLAEQIERLMAAFAQDCPGYHDSIVLLDSTPVECGRSVETARRSQLGVACAHHYSRSHLEFPRFRGHLIAGPSGPAMRISVHACAVSIGVPPRGDRAA